MTEEKYSRIMARLTSYHNSRVFWSPSRVRAYNRAVNFTRRLYLGMPND